MSGACIELEIALKKLHQLQLEDGDLGAPYWYEISQLLKSAADYRSRALAAGEKMHEIKAMLDDG